MMKKENNNCPSLLTASKHGVRNSKSKVHDVHHERNLDEAWLVIFSDFLGRREKGFALLYNRSERGGLKVKI